MTSVHVSVMSNEVLEYLKSRLGGNFLDCTLGGAGHTKAILEANHSNHVIGIDRDERALSRALIFLSDYKDRFTAVHGKFSECIDLLEQRNFDGMLVDLGLSTDQLKEDRGFSFKDTNSLDMRMDETETTITADEIVNNYGESQLIKIFLQGGAEKEAKKAARTIVKNRPIKNSEHLASILKDALFNPREHRVKSHPATTVFQAIRMEVNQEVQQIKDMLDSAPKLVKKGGRLCVITFHSLEDKLVTKQMRSWAQGDTTPAYMGVMDKGSLGKFLTTKALTPSEQEVVRNPASRSARLRVFEFNGDIENGNCS